MPPVDSPVDTSVHISDSFHDVFKVRAAAMITAPAPLWPPAANARRRTCSLAHGMVRTPPQGFSYAAPSVLHDMRQQRPSGLSHEVMGATSSVASSTTDNTPIDTCPPTPSGETTPVVARPVSALSAALAAAAAANGGSPRVTVN